MIINWNKGGSNVSQLWKIEFEKHLNKNIFVYIIHIKNIYIPMY